MEVEEEGEGSDSGERKSIRLPAFTADIHNRFVIPQLPSLQCHIWKYIFKFILKSYSSIPPTSVA